MISPKDFCQRLTDNGVDFVTGVPDSLLKELCAYLDAALPPENHIISANEGSAIALAAGANMATGRVPVVYLQNSGLGNTVNPLVSLVDPAVYQIPLVLIIGWRGRPGVSDEPQHVKQGEITPALLDAMGIPFKEISGDPPSGDEAVDWAFDLARKEGRPTALLVHKGAFSKAEQKREVAEHSQLTMQREEAIALIASTLPSDRVIVATTGMISRELYEQRKLNDQDRSGDFLTVGSMGHASQIALGLALSAPEREVVCLDGDGAMLMHMGGLASIGSGNTQNYFHIVLNNGAHDSVGGQPTVGFDIKLTDIAKACGYEAVEGPIWDAASLENAIQKLSAASGKRFLEVRVKRGNRADLGRPKETPVQNKEMFLENLRGGGSNGG